MSKYGGKIKQLRQLEKMSQKDLALKLNVPISTLCYWERIDYPPLQGIEKVCDYFNITISEYFDSYF